MYLAVLIDLHSRRVVGWAMDDNMRTDLVLAALHMAVGLRRPAPGLMHHSDQGSQYASQSYQDALNGYGILCSMSRKGECWDNAVSESFFGRMKEELIYRSSWPTKSSVKAAVREYIMSFYNNQRLHSSLGFLSPQAYEASATGHRIAA